LTASVDSRELRARRAVAQRLVDPESEGAAELVRHLLAVQAQDLRAARLALRARSTGMTAAGVDRALTEERSLVVTWLMRRTLHLVAAEDLGWLLALIAPGREAASRRRLGQEGVPWEDAERAVGVVERALADEGPLTRAELAERLAARGIRVAGQATPHLLGLAALRGVAVLGPVRADGQAFALVRDWLPGALADLPPRPVALAELARRYLVAHGPARAEDLAGWAGIGLRDARAGFEGVARGARLVDVGDGLADLAERRGVPGSPLPPRLLGAFDPYLLGWRDRSFAVAPEHARRVHPGGGILRAVASVDGVAAGTWGVRRHDGRIAVTVEPFAPLAPEVVAALDAERADVARFEGAALA
jgi:Winged helix DNA-binding domain